MIDLEVSSHFGHRAYFTYVPLRSPDERKQLGDTFVSILFFCRAHLSLKLLLLVTRNTHGRG